MKLFMKQGLTKLQFLADTDSEGIHDIMYNMKLRKHQKGETLQKPGDSATDLIYVQDGEIEVYVQLDDQNFVIDRLFRGSIVNYRNWFMEDNAYVFLRFAKDSIVQILEIAKFYEICRKNPDMEKAFLKYQKETFSEAKTYPLDYIINNVKAKQESYYTQQQQMKWKLINILKNVVMRRIVEIKANKAKPKFHEIVKILI